MSRMAKFFNYQQANRAKGSIITIPSSASNQAAQKAQAIPKAPETQKTSAPKLSGEELQKYIDIVAEAAEGFDPSIDTTTAALIRLLKQQGLTPLLT